MKARVSAKICSPLLRLARRVFRSGIGFSFGKRRLLFGAGFLLVLGFPLGVRHAVNHFAGIIEADLDLAFIGSCLVPLGQAVAAEAGEVHQVDVLHILAAVQMGRSEEHTSELQSLMRISYAVFCLKKKKKYTHK